MAGLNLDPGLEAKQDTSLLELSSSPPSSGPDNTVTTCLGVIPQNDLHKIANRTDIIEFIERGNQDLESALKIAQAIVHQRHKLSKAVKLHCAFDIRTVWREIADYTSRTPAATATITQWQQDIRRDIDIDHYLSMADSTLQKYSRYIDRIQLAWGMPINIALPQGLIPPIGWLSKPLMQKMAQLAEQTSREEAAILLKENVGQRTGPLTRTAHARYSPYLTLSDVSSALERSKAKVLKAPEPGKRAHAGPTDNARKKRKAAPAPDESLASDRATSSAGSELEHDGRGHASGPRSDGKLAIAEDIVEPQIREEQDAVDNEQGVGIGGDSIRVGRQVQDDDRQVAGGTSFEDREVSGDQTAGHNDFDSNEMSIEQGRGADIANLDDFDNTTRSSWPLERSAPPTPMSGQPSRSSELPDALNSDLGDTSLSTFDALVPFQNNGSNILDAHSCLMSKSQLTPLPASRSVTAATCNSEPLGEGATMTNTLYQAAELQAAVSVMEDHHPDVREVETLEASELSYQRGSLSPKVKSLSETSGNTVGMVSTTGKSAVVKVVIESNTAGKQPVECTTDTAAEHDKAQASSRLCGQDTSYDSEMIASETRRTTLLTLQPGEQLSSTAIHEVISCVKPADCYIFDPLFFKSQPVFQFSNGFQIEDTITRILLPIHDSQRKHWYLAVLTISDSTIKIYDSISCKEQSLSQSTHLESFARTVKPQQQAWTVRLAECPQQNNGYDCGICMIINALQVMAQGSLPAAYDCATWRLLCRSLLGETVDNDQFNSLIEIVDSKTNELAPSDTQANDQDSWILDGFQRAVREAEICLRTLQMKQACLKSLHDASRSSLHTIRVLHERVREENNNLAKELQSQLRSHSDMLKEYASSIIMETPESQTPELQKALCSIRSTQTAMDTRLWRAEREAKSLKNNIERLSAAILTGQRIEEAWETKIQQAEMERQAKIQQLESWREQFDLSSIQIAQLLAKHRSLEG